MSDKDVDSQPESYWVYRACAFKAADEITAHAFIKKQDANIVITIFLIIGVNRPLDITITSFFSHFLYQFWVEKKKSQIKFNIIKIYQSIDF